MTEVRLAPLAGITDWPFRLLCQEQGSDGASTEMVSAMGFCCNPGAVAVQCLLERHPAEKRLVLQLFGKEPEIMARAAAALSDTGRYDGININMGCPAHKVAASGEGSGLMRDPRLAARIITAVAGATQLPVSVKLRLGWDAEHINVLELARIAEECGAREIAVHGRTRMQMYSGQADWGWIARVKQAAHIPVYGNGDIFTAEDAWQRIRETGVDGVLLARGACGNPWLFSQIRQRLRGEPVTLPGGAERVEMALRHYDLMLGWKPERIAVSEMRKHIAWYLHGLRGAAALRNEINTMTGADAVRRRLRRFEHELEG